MHKAMRNLPIGTTSILPSHGIVLFVKVLVGPLLMKSSGVDRAFLMLYVLVVVEGVHGGPVARSHIPE